VITNKIGPATTGSAISIPPTRGPHRRAASVTPTTNRGASATFSTSVSTRATYTAPTGHQLQSRLRLSTKVDVTDRRPALLDAKPEVVVAIMVDALLQGLLAVLLLLDGLFDIGIAPGVLGLVGLVLAVRRLGVLDLLSFVEEEAAEAVMPHSEEPPHDGVRPVRLPA
jgi:hypothetical protein